MRYLLTLTCALLLLLNSCKKSGEKSTVSFNGTYKGTYQKVGPTYQMPQTANVTLSFSDNSWSGNTDVSMYPGLCNGTFSVKGDKITFVNLCVWAAVATPGDILQGEFTISKNAGIVTLTQTKGNSVNQYELAKQ